MATCRPESDFLTEVRFQKSLPALPRLSLKSPHIAENWAHSKPVLGDLRRHWAASSPLPYQP